MLYVLSLSVLVGWLLGSIPVAYLVVRIAGGGDLRHEGSASVGATNAYRVSGSRLVAAVVLLLDVAKGALSVLLALWLMQAFAPGAWEAPFWSAAGGLLGAVAGHNYNPLLSWGHSRLAGGKGLATACGGLLLLMPAILPVWIAAFGVGFLAFSRWRGVRSALPGNVLATLVSPLAAWWWYGLAGLFVVALLAFLILPRHRRQLHALLSTPGLLVSRAHGSDE